MQEKGMMEKICENVEFAEAKGNSLKKSILKLMVDWRDFEKHLGTTHKCLKECLSELESKELHLKSVQESVSQSSEELRLMRNEIEEKVKGVEDRERELFLLQEKGMMELEAREKEWVLSREKFDEEFGKREGKLSEKEEAAKGFFGELELEKKEIIGLNNMVQERIKEVELKEKYLEERRKEIELIQDRIEKRASELDGRERKVKNREKRVDFKEMRTMWGEREREIEMKEKEVILMREDLELKEKGLDIVRKLNEKREKGIEMREEELEVKKKEYEITLECLEEAHLKEQECLLEKDSLEKGYKELELKKKEFEDRVKGLNELEMRAKQLEIEKKELEVAKECLKGFHLAKKEYLLEKESLEKGYKDLELKKREFEKGVKELEMREKQLEIKERELEAAKEFLKELHLTKKEYQLEKESLEKGNRELELKKKEVEDMIREFGLREKELEFKEKKLNDELHAHAKNEPVEKLVDESLIGKSSSPHFRFSLEMDGLELHMFLNSCEINLNSPNEVFKALQLSGDPAYLVLNAMGKLYPPHLRKVGMEFEGRIADSCILLLDQLIRISPKIQSFMRNEALKLANEWKAMIKTRNSLEVLGFLYLLASFDLASAFDAREVLKFLEIVAQHQQTTELCRCLGFKDKIPGFIGSLIKSKRFMEAIRFIYAFELVDHFPPVPILKSYLKHVKKIANRKSKERSNRLKRQNEAIDVRIAAMRAVIRSIVDHKLESQYSPKILEGSIQQLLMHKVHEKHSGSAIHHKVPDQKVVEKIVVPSTPGYTVHKAQDVLEVEGIDIPANTGSDNHHKPQDQQEVVGKNVLSATATNCMKDDKIASEFFNTEISAPHAMALILANMDGKSFLSFLNSHMVEHELLQNEVSTALRIRDDSAKLVLDAVEGFYCSHQKEQEAKSCIFLLEQLIRLSPCNIMDVMEMAQRIAFDWKAKIRAEIERPLVVLGFLLFISIFKLISAFDVDEILHLYKRSVKHKHVPGLCQALGIAKMISESQQARSENLQLNIEATSSCAVITKDVKSFCNNADTEREEHISVCREIPLEIPLFIQNSSDPAQLVLDALWNCYHSNSNENMISQLIVKSFFHLLKQLKSVSPVIKPSVKDRAFKFAVEWKSRLTGTNSLEVLGFLQLLAIYELSPFFSADELLGFLEISCEHKEAINLFRLLGLKDKVLGFILVLTKKERLLLAFEYVYEFNLVDKIPPVALLKKHVWHSRMVAKEIYNDGQKTPEAQEKATVYEISALRSVIKCILDHGLQSEYPPDQLRERVMQLESWRADLKTPIPIPVSEKLPKPETHKELPVVSESQLKQEDTKKRPTPDNAIANEDQLPPPNKYQRLARPAEASQYVQLANGQHLYSVQPSSQHPGVLYTERYGPDTWAAARHYSLGSSTPILQHVNHFRMVSNNLPPYRIAGGGQHFAGLHLSGNHIL